MAEQSYSPRQVAICYDFEVTKNMALMTKALPEFDAPPVVETVLGGQFETLELSNALAGWYWKSKLGDKWPTATDAVRLDDVFERFGDERIWTDPGPTIRFSQKPRSRLQIVREDGTRMVQVQDSRFVYNWKKSKESSYPTYQILLPEFKDQVGKFSDFVQSAEIGPVTFNQWEVIYVNRIPRGVLWKTLRDWSKIFPNFQFPVDDSVPDSFVGAWQLNLAGNRGRLHIELKHVKTEDGEELSHLQLTARGPVDENVDLYAGFDLGHETIVHTFANMTSELAHKHWKRKL
jgi:uncharacterized protein (TIGR04255 family)